MTLGIVLHCKNDFTYAIEFRIKLKCSMVFYGTAECFVAEIECSCCCKELEIYSSVFFQMHGNVSK